MNSDARFAVCGYTVLLHNRGFCPCADLAPPSTPPQPAPIDTLIEAKTRRDTIRNAIVAELRRTPHNLTLAALLKADDEATEALQSALSQT